MEKNITQGKTSTFWEQFLHMCPQVVLHKKACANRICPFLSIQFLRKISLQQISYSTLRGRGEDERITDLFFDRSGVPTIFFRKNVFAQGLVQLFEVGPPGVEF